ncbi:ATP-binding cassette domain-containing protein [Litoreibacter ponti]|nr:ATP-binding cassette domain-containing protein [Litoreibacter ponti]
MPAAPEKAGRFSKKLRARAELVSVYAGLLGVDMQPSDVVDAAVELPLDAAGVTPELIAKAMKSLGLVSGVRKTPLRADLWPALVEMKTGQLVLVLEQHDQTLTLFDQTVGDRRAEVPLAEFAAVFSGKVLKAESSIAQVEQKHKLDAKPKHWFWGEFTKYKKHLVEICAGSFVANLLAVAVALFSLQVYDRVIPHQSHATLWVLAIGAMGALTLEAFLKIARARMMDGAGRKLEVEVQRTLMQRLLGMKAGTPGATPSGTFSAMREFSSVREFFTASTVGSLTDVPFIFLFLALVFSIAGNVVWILIAGGVLMVLPGFFLQKRMMRLTEETQGASIKANRLLHEAIYEADTVKTHRGEDRFARTWDELTAVSALKSSEQRRLASALTFWSQGMQQATYVAAVVMGTFLVFAGEFTVGSIIAVGILTSRTLAPLTQLAGTMARWSNVKTALTALDEVVDAPQDYDPARSYLRREKITGRYELRDLIHRYDEDAAPVLDLGGMAIPAGQHVAVLGANGSGKSTLLKLLTGLYSPGQGRVLIDGIDMEQVHPKDLRRGIGYLSQEVRLFAGSLRDNLNLSGLERDDARLMDALDFAGLGRFVREHAKGLDLPIHDGGAGLSIGQRQSIGWARLWLQDPRVVLLDEPTAALDSALETALVAKLADWLKGRTSVIATHRMPILTLTERVLVLRAGKLSVDGPRADVLAHLQKAQGAPKGLSISTGKES